MDNLPKPSSYDAHQLDLEVEAMERGETIEQALQRRAVEQGYQIVSPDENERPHSRLQKLGRFIKRIIR
jgi:hypothetical protein